MNGTLKKCFVGHDAWLTCSSHAMSTEKQEVMGLLLGRWLVDARGVGTVAVVESAMVLARTDRRKDRVEVGYEQLAAASEMAEQQGRRSGREVNRSLSPLHTPCGRGSKGVPACWLGFSAHNPSGACLCLLMPWFVCLCVSSAA
jgi:BRCA1/BRCA2-containing complex subunit 3